MAKQGQHKGDAADGPKPRGHNKSKGHNNPSQSMTITTGSYKKPETSKKQAYEHKDPYKQAQSADNDWDDDIRQSPSIQGSTRARNPGSGRSGSDSNASRKTRGY